MKIHTSKRAMFMRSVDRRNDSFGADTEGFALSSQRKAQITRRNDSFGADTEGFALSSQRKAQITRRNDSFGAQEPKKFVLSSQRKLSVLLLVGLVILSAKECEMDPVVRDPLAPTKTVKVTHGASLAADDAFGRSVAFAGDLDGGGGTVLAVGAPRDNTGGVRRGAIYLLSYNAAGVFQSTKKIAHGLDETNANSNANTPTLANTDFFGQSIANAGDLDGDGGTVLAVGADSDATGGESRGAIHLLSFDPDGALQSTKKIAHGLDETNAGNTNAPTLANIDVFGQSIANAGNLYGDGNTVLAVGAPGDNTNGDSRGAIYLLSFSPAGSLTAVPTKIASGTTEGPSLANSDFFGTSLANAGDLDGGGGTILAVGATGSVALHLLSFSATGTLQNTKKIADGVDETNEGSNTNAPTLADDNSGFGVHSIANAGDLDGGGGTVLAVGAPFDSSTTGGAIYLLSFDATGSLTATPKKIAHGTAGGPVLTDGYTFGISLASVGNLGGSGGTVLAVGGTGGPTKTNKTGELQLLYFSPAAKK